MTKTLSAGGDYAHIYAGLSNQGFPAMVAIGGCGLQEQSAAQEMTRPAHTVLEANVEPPP
jgi:hypothetical protein